MSYDDDGRSSGSRGTSGTRSTRCRPTSRGLLDNVAIVVEDEPPPDEDLLGPLPRHPADRPDVVLRRRPPDLIHDLPRPPRALLRPRPGAAARAGQAHRAARDRPPLRDQRRAPRRDRPLLAGAPSVRGLPRLPGRRWTARSSAAPAAGTTRRVDGIPRLLDPTAPGLDAKLRELAGWPELAKEQGWYEADDRIDAALPFLNRDLGWEDRAWAATEHGFQLLLDRYVKPGDRVLEIGAAKSWASLHLAAARLRVRRLRPRRRPADRPRPRRASSRSASARTCGSRPTASGCRSPTARFDVAFCVATLHHALDLRAMVGELARVTRRGGIVAALNEGTRAPYRSGANPEQEHEKELGINEHVHTMWAYVWAFARAGLRPVRLEYAQGPGELAPAEHRRQAAARRDDCRRRCGR